MTVKHNDQQIAELLLGDVPLDYKRYPDGSLVVIAASGQKFRYSQEAITAAYPKIPSKPSVKPPIKPPVQRSSKTSVSKG